MRVMMQVRPDPELVAAVGDPLRTVAGTDLAANLTGLQLDGDFEPVLVPQPVPADAGGDPLSLRQPIAYSRDAERASVLVRGELDDADLGPRTAMLLAANPAVVGVFADPRIEPFPTCGGDPPVGDADDVAAMIGVDELAAADCDGEGVAVAVVDTGINLDHLEQRLGWRPRLDEDDSWTPRRVQTPPGGHPVGHGTMCAYDVLIAAPKARLLDVALLQSQREGRTAMDGLLSDGVRAFAQLRDLLDAMPERRARLVVNNSWGMFDPRWDFPPGHPGNYSDSMAHPFNIVVGSLESAGADILFAAGNCGRDCPDGRCAFGAGQPPICGANSHPAVLSVAGVDVSGQRVGYSSQGPGRLAVRKPDLCAPTHFLGSAAFGSGEPDSGTSAACPVLAGVVAAVRTHRSARDVAPDRMRTLVRRSAKEVDGPGFDDDHGHGIVDGAALVAALPAEGAA